MRPQHIAQLLDSIIQSPAIPGRLKMTVLLTGSPGVGKTSLPKQAALRNKLPLLFTQPLFSEPVDYSGVPFVYQNGVPENARTIWAPPGWVPTVPCLFLIDEATQCDPPMMKAIAPICEEHRIGATYLAPGSVVVATGNKSGHRAGAHRLLSHVQRRVCEIPFESNLDDFEDWGMATGRIIPEVRYFLRFKPDGLNNFDPASDLPYACQGGWEKVSDIYHMLPPHLLHQTIQGLIGPEAASFLAFAQIWRELTFSFDVEKILKNPEKAPVPKRDQLDIIWSLVGSIAEFVKEKEVATVNKALAYFQRLPREFLFIGTQHVYAKQGLQRRAEIKATEEFQKFFQANAHLMTESTGMPGVKK